MSTSTTYLPFSAFIVMGAVFAIGFAICAVSLWLQTNEIVRLHSFIQRQQDELAGTIKQRDQARQRVIEVAGELTRARAEKLRTAAEDAREEIDSLLNPQPRF